MLVHLNDKHKNIYDMWIRYIIALNTIEKK